MRIDPKSAEAFNLSVPGANNGKPFHSATVAGPERIPADQVAGIDKLLDRLERAIGRPAVSPVDQVPAFKALVSVFIAAPYSGDGKLDGPAVLEARGTPAAEALNARVAESIRVSEELISAGFCPINPLFFHFQNLCFPRGRSTWLRLSLELVRRSDAVLRLPGPSAGADKEIEYAHQAGIPVVYSLDELRRLNFMERTI
jgi:hypothetical protein